MELSNIGFEYNIKIIEHTSYNFNILSEVKSKEDLIDKAKSSLKNLENLLEEFYSGKRFSKEQEGNIRSDIISFGVKYSNSNSFFSRIKGNVNTSLNYNIFFNSDGNPYSLNLNLYNSDTNEERLMFIYDKIILNNDIILSKKAKVQSERINILRKKSGFNLNEYLCLPEPA